MKQLAKKNEAVSTVLSFILIPLSGFAMDVYVPSFPQMAADLHVTAADIQLTLTLFLVSYGVSQLFVGTLVDSYGRYRLSLMALMVFILSNLIIVVTQNIGVIFIMRVVQGLAISIIMISKRAFFNDVYTGEKLKHYTSLISVVWSAAPILAPFFGGYLQQHFGWRANFYFLGFYGLLMLILELRYSGETIKTYKPFHLGSIFGVYRKLLGTADFRLGIGVLGFSYSMAIIFGMVAPFIIQRTFHYSAVVTGYCALLSGTALLLGGIVSKYLISRPFYRKLSISNFIQCFFAGLMLFCASWYSGLPMLMAFVAALHFLMGFIYNIYFTYCLTRFPENAGVAGGVTSGGSYIITSIVSYGMVNLIHVNDISSLAVSYCILTVIIALILFLVKKRLPEHML